MINVEKFSRLEKASGQILFGFHPSVKFKTPSKFKENISAFKKTEKTNNKMKHIEIENLLRIQKQSNTKEENLLLIKEKLKEGPVNIKVDINNLLDLSKISTATIPSTGAEFNVFEILNQRNFLTVSDFIQMIPTIKNAIVETFEANETGEPAYLGEVDANPEMSFEIKDKVFVTKQSKVYTKVSEDLLDDEDYLNSKIEDLLKNRIKEKMDIALISGDPTQSANQFEGLKKLGVAFDQSKTALKGKLGTLTAESYIEVLTASITNQKALGYSTNLIMVNPNDLSLINLKYKNNELERLPELVPSFEIASGEYLSLDTRFIYNRIKSLNVQLGYFDDDFIKDVSSLKAKIRHVLVINPNQAGSCIVGNFATDSASLNQ